MCASLARDVEKDVSNGLGKRDNGSSGRVPCLVIKHSSIFRVRLFLPDT